MTFLNLLDKITPGVLLSEITNATDVCQVVFNELQGCRSFRMTLRCVETSYKGVPQTNCIEVRFVFENSNPYIPLTFNYFNPDGFNAILVVGSPKDEPPTKLIITPTIGEFKKISAKLEGLPNQGDSHGDGHTHGTNTTPIE